MKTETITTAVISTRNKLQPSFNDNHSILVFDYDFYTSLESFSKKEREKAKEKMLLAADGTVKEGVILRTAAYEVSIKTSKAPVAFSLEEFITAICKAYPDVQKHKLRSLATESVVPGTPRKSYIVEASNE